MQFAYQNFTSSQIAFVAILLVLVCLVSSESVLV